MERITLRIPKQQIEGVERMVETGEFPNRSEVIRSAVRELLAEQDGRSERRTSEHQSSERRSERRSSERSWAKV